jgi:peptidyl-prolyl cis-trans isomerase SurA
MSYFRRPFVAILLAVGALVQVTICNVDSAETEPTVVDGIAAIVNGEVITYSQVRALSAPQERLLRQQYTGDELVKKLTELRQLSVKDLIDRRLVIQAIQQIIKEAFGGDRNTFVKTLEAQNYTLGEFKQKEMEKIIVGAMRSKNVKTNSVVSPTKIEEYYRKHHDEFTSKEQIKLRMIMISGHKDTASAPAQKELAEEVLGKLASGAEFEQLAQVYSEDSTKDNGGDWGWIERKTLAEPLEKFAFNMPVGRISNIIDYAGNYYILKVEDKHGGSTKSLNEVRADIEKKLVQEEAQQIQERWIASLREKAYIKTF